MCSTGDGATKKQNPQNTQAPEKTEKKTMATEAKKPYIQPGTYDAKPLDWGIRDKQRKDGGSYSIYFIEFELLDEANKGKKTVYEQNLFNREGAMTEKTAEILMKNLKAIGMTNDDPADPVVPVPQEVKLVLVNEPYDGKDQIKIKYINSKQEMYNPKNKFVEVGEDKKKAFRAAFSTAHKAVGDVSSPPKANPAAFGDSGTDEDIPF